MGGFAWVTLATNDSYSLGALVLGHSLKRVNTSHQLAVLITPAVSQPMKEQLQSVFDVVKVVDVLDSKDETNLALLKRPELGITFTKLHCWRLTEFEKCVFLDADTLVVRNCDELFEREELSAAPDVGWPDCFNTGVFVYKPAVETFNNLVQLAVDQGSFDGGDQGLLNQYFSDWATQDIKKHLPFVYNLTSVAVYSYIPAFKHYGNQIRIVHFIGPAKPWLQQLDPATRTIAPTPGAEHLGPLLQNWWDIFCEKVHPSLSQDLECASGMLNLQVDDRSKAIALETSDEPGFRSELIEPFTPYKEKDDSRQINLPYHPFEVKSISGESLTQMFLQAREREKQMKEEEERRLEEQRRREEEERLEREKKEKEDQAVIEEEESRKDDENDDGAPQEKIPEPEESHPEPENKQNEEPPPQHYNSPFDYHTFYPDETCISTYLEQNVNVYQPFDSPKRNEEHVYHQPEHVQHQPVHEQHQPEHVHPQPEPQPVYHPPPLPRFLTIPENDPRQSNQEYVDHSQGSSFVGPTDPEMPVPMNSFEKFIEEYTHPSVLEQRRLQSSHENLHRSSEDPFGGGADLQKSKSMSNLSEPTAAAAPTVMSGTFWKSQPNVNADPHKKFAMPKLKPLVPKQSSPEPVKIVESRPKITLYTEFHMSSDYKDPVKLPGDNIGFVERQILKEKKKPDHSNKKFGALPYMQEPYVPEPSPPKQKSSPLKDIVDYVVNVDYDLSECRRQAGNKPLPKDNTKKSKENTFFLPELKPLVPEDDKRDLFKRKKSDERLQVPGDERRKKKEKKDSRKARERKRKETNKKPPEVYEPTTDVNEILKKLVNYTKDYEDYFKIAEETAAKRKTPSPTIMINGKEIEGEFSPVEFYDKEYYFKSPASEFGITEPDDDECEVIKRRKGTEEQISNKLESTEVKKLIELASEKIEALYQERAFAGESSSGTGIRAEQTSQLSSANGSVIEVEEPSVTERVLKTVAEQKILSEEPTQVKESSLVTEALKKTESAEKGAADAEGERQLDEQSSQTEQFVQPTEVEESSLVTEASKKTENAEKGAADAEAEGQLDEQSSQTDQFVQPPEVEEVEAKAILDVGAAEREPTDAETEKLLNEQITQPPSELTKPIPVEEVTVETLQKSWSVESEPGSTQVEEELDERSCQPELEFDEAAMMEIAERTMREIKAARAKMVKPQARLPFIRQSKQSQSEWTRRYQAEKVKEETLSGNFESNAIDVRMENVSKDQISQSVSEEIQVSESTAENGSVVSKDVQVTDGEPLEIAEKPPADVNVGVQPENIESEEAKSVSEPVENLQSIKSHNDDVETTKALPERQNTEVDQFEQITKGSEDTAPAVQSGEMFTSKADSAHSAFELTEQQQVSTSAPFRQFRSFVKDRIESSQKGLLGIPDILPEPIKPKKTFASGMVISHALIPPVEPTPHPEIIPRDEQTQETEPENVNVANLDSDSGVSTDETEPAKSPQRSEDWTNLQDVTNSVAELVLNEPEEPMSEASKPLSYASVAQKIAPVPSASTSTFQPRKSLAHTLSPPKHSFSKKSSQPRKIKQPSQEKSLAPSSPPAPKQKSKKVEKPAEEVQKPSNIFEVLSDDSPDESVSGSVKPPLLFTKKTSKSKKNPKSTASKTTLAPSANLTDAPRVNIDAEDANRESETHLADPNDNSGIAGAIAHLSLESEKEPTEASTSAQEEYLRRQNWETGKIDYLGRDSFDNIWSKICETLEKKETDPETPDLISQQSTEILNLSSTESIQLKEPAAAAAAVPSSTVQEIEEFPDRGPVSLSMILNDQPSSEVEYIDTLPPEIGDVSGSVSSDEDDIIFVKSGDRHAYLSNIIEETIPETEEPEEKAGVEEIKSVAPERLKVLCTGVLENSKESEVKDLNDFVLVEKISKDMDSSEGKVAEKEVAEEKVGEVEKIAESQEKIDGTPLFSKLAEGESTIVTVDAPAKQETSEEKTTEESKSQSAEPETTEPQLTETEAQGKPEEILSSETLGCRSVQTTVAEAAELPIKSTVADVFEKHLPDEDSTTVAKVEPEASQENVAKSESDELKSSRSEPVAEIVAEQKPLESCPAEPIELGKDAVEKPEAEVEHLVKQENLAGQESTERKSEELGKELKETSKVDESMKVEEPAKVETVNAEEPVKIQESEKVERSVKVEELINAEEPTKAEEPVKIEEPTKAREPVKVEEPTKAEEPVKVEEPIKAEESLKTKEPVEVVEPIKAAESAKAEEFIKAKEPVKVEEPTKAEESVKAEEPIKVEDPIKVEESVKLEEPIKAEEAVEVEECADEQTKVEVPVKAEEPTEIEESPKSKEPVVVEEPVKIEESTKVEEPAKLDDLPKAEETAESGESLEAVEPVRVEEAKESAKVDEPAKTEALAKVEDISKGEEPVKVEATRITEELPKSSPGTETPAIETPSKPEEVTSNPELIPEKSLVEAPQLPQNPSSSDPEEKKKAEIISDEKKLELNPTNPKSIPESLSNPGPSSPNPNPNPSEPSKKNGKEKEKKGVISKILEFVGVSPKQKKSRDESESSKSVFYDDPEKNVVEKKSECRTSVFYDEPEKKVVVEPEKIPEPEPEPVRKSPVPHIPATLIETSFLSAQEKSILQGNETIDEILKATDLSSISDEETSGDEVVQELIQIAEEAGAKIDDSETIESITGKLQSLTDGLKQLDSKKEEIVPDLSEEETLEISKVVAETFEKIISVLEDPSSYVETPEVAQKMNSPPESQKKTPIFLESVENPLIETESLLSEINDILEEAKTYVESHNCPLECLENGKVEEEDEIPEDCIVSGMLVIGKRKGETEMVEPTKIIEKPIETIGNLAGEAVESVEKDVEAIEEHVIKPAEEIERHVEKPVEEIEEHVVKLVETIEKDIRDPVGSIKKHAGESVEAIAKHVIKPAVEIEKHAEKPEEKIEEHMVKVTETIEKHIGDPVESIKKHVGESLSSIEKEVAEPVISTEKPVREPAESNEISSEVIEKPVEKLSEPIEEHIGKIEDSGDELDNFEDSVEKLEEEPPEEPVYSNVQKIDSKLIATEPPEPPKTPEFEVEEIKITSEEERKKHKTQQPSASKLSGQILKAIPPPRRKAISEARGRPTGAIPKTNVNVVLEQKISETMTVEERNPTPPPVPPRRNRSKPREPPLPPPKRKTKK